MRDLAKPDVVKSAAIAAALGTLASYPRLALWPQPGFSPWYFAALLAFNGFVLWAFVFAWHTKYTQRPVFNFKPGAWPIALVTGAGILMAALQHWLIDPPHRVRLPADFPANLQEWLAMTLFILAFFRVFVVFAAFDWAIRLFKYESVAILVTVLFAVIVVALKLRSMPEISAGLACLLLLARALSSLVTVWLYARYGVLMVWWWSLLLEARHLLTLL